MLQYVTKGVGDMEKTDRLWPGGYAFVFDDTLFQPSTDSFLLGHFVRTRRGDRVCDLGAGTGLLGLLLLARQAELSVTDMEIQEAACDLARRSAERNGLTHRITVLQQDLCRLDQLPRSAFDVVVTNPPYFSADRGAASPDPARSAARSEIRCTLEDVCAAADHLLRYGGHFFLVFRPDRMAELFALLQKYRLEPKRLRFVQHNAGSAPSLLLLECRKGGKTGLTVEPPLLLKNPDGRDTAEANQVYFRDR